MIDGKLDSQGTGGSIESTLTSSVYWFLGHIAPNLDKSITVEYIQDLTEGDSLARLVYV